MIHGACELDNKNSVNAKLNFPSPDFVEDHPELQPADCRRVHGQKSNWVAGCRLVVFCSACPKEDDPCDGDEQTTGPLVLARWCTEALESDLVGMPADLVRMAKKFLMMA